MIVSLASVIQLSLTFRQGTDEARMNSMWDFILFIYEFVVLVVNWATTVNDSEFVSFCF